MLSAAADDDELENMFDDVGLAPPEPSAAATTATTTGTSTTSSTAKSSALQDVDDLLSELDSEFAIDDSDDGGVSGEALTTLGEQRAAPQSVVESGSSGATGGADTTDEQQNATTTENVAQANVDAALASIGAPVVASEVDPWAQQPSDDADAAPAHDPAHDTSADQPTHSDMNNNNSEAMQRLRSSTAKLTQTVSTRATQTASDLDRRYHLRDTVSQGVANLDSDYQIKERTSNLWSTLRGSISQVGGSITASAGAVGSTLGVDSTQVSSRAAEVTQSVTQKAKGVGSEIGNAVREGTKLTAPAREALNERFGDRLSRVGELASGVRGSVRQVDEQYGISARTVETLAGGAELLATSLGGDEQDVSAGEVGAIAEAAEGDIEANEAAAPIEEEGQKIENTSPTTEELATVAGEKEEADTQQV